MCGVKGTVVYHPMGSRASARVARVMCMTACAVAAAEERAATGVGTAAGGTSVSLRRVVT